MNPNQLRCLLISDGILYKPANGKKQWLTRNLFYRFAAELARSFEHLTLFSPARKTDALFDHDSFYAFKERHNLSVAEAGDFNSVIEYYRRLPFVFRANRSALKRLIQDHDVALLRLPSMNAIAFAGLLEKSGLPLCTYMVGDQEEIVATGGKYSGIKAILGKTAARYHSARMKRLMQTAGLAIFLGDSLYRKHHRVNKNSRMMFTSIVREAEIVYRDTKAIQNAPVRVVFAGRLAHEKGWAYLFEAVKLLTEQGKRIRLTVCGTGPEAAKAKQVRDRLGLAKTIRFKGFVPPRPDLGQIFFQSDIFVLPSLSEGVPKVLLEAMAKGLAIIATSVGGVGDIVRHEKNGMLIRPKSAVAIADAIERLASDPGLYQHIVTNGYAYVRQHSLESQSRRLADMIKGA